MLGRGGRGRKALRGGPRPTSFFNGGLGQPRRDIADGWLAAFLPGVIGRKADFCWVGKGILGVFVKQCLERFPHAARAFSDQLVEPA